MTLYDEIYFEITCTGAKSEIKKLADFLKAGGLDDFFEFSRDYLSYDDSYSTAEDAAETSLTLSTDDYGIEIEELDSDEFLDVLCRAARKLDVVGHIYDIDEEEYRFFSEPGDSYYLNADKVTKFNEDLDKEKLDSES